MPFAKLSQYDIDLFLFMANRSELCSPYDFQKNNTAYSKNYAKKQRTFKYWESRGYLYQHESVKTNKEVYKTQYSLSILGFNEALKYICKKHSDFIRIYDEYITENEKCRLEYKESEYTEKEIKFIIEERENYENLLISIIEAQATNIKVLGLFLKIISNIKECNLSHLDDLNPYNIDFNSANIFKNRICNEITHVEYFIYTQIILSALSYENYLEYMYNSNQNLFAKYIFCNIIKNIGNETFSNLIKERIISGMQNEKEFWRDAEILIYNQIIEHLNPILMLSQGLMNNELYNHSKEMMKNVKSKLE